jgi:hypothetical protein
VGVSNTAHRLSNEVSACLFLVLLNDAVRVSAKDELERMRKEAVMAQLEGLRDTTKTFS